MKMKSTIVCLAVLAMSNANSANTVTQVGRYATVENKPTAAQVNPLLTVQQMQFPQRIQSVGDALNYWLKHSGYQLVDAKKQSAEMKEVLKHSLPQVDRNLGPISVQDGLKVLVGMNVFDLVQDPLHRKVSFTLNKQYKRAYQSKRGRA
jgi:conjugative transfer region protein (TIGR03748 family)